MNCPRFTASFLAEQVGGELVGEDCGVSELATLKEASHTSLSFLSNDRYRAQLKITEAAAVLVREPDSERPELAFIVVADPYLAYAKLSQLFVQRAEPVAGIAQQASVHKSATIHPSAQICAGAVIEAGAVLAERVYIGPNTVVGESVVIGSNTRVEANVTLYCAVRVGRDCLIHSGAVIGADGFGFAPSDQGWQKIAQLGSVLIEDQVEIGAGTTIDRGALSDTHIGRGVKLDNQIQIAHNVKIGDETAIAGGTAIAGSTEIGKRCTIAGMTGITGHLKIADGTHVTAMTLVSRSISEAGAYSSGTGLEPHQQWKRNVVRFRQLDQLAQRVKAIEKRLEEFSPKG